MKEVSRYQEISLKAVRVIRKGLALANSSCIPFGVSVWVASWVPCAISVAMAQPTPSNRADKISLSRFGDVTISWPVSSSLSSQNKAAPFAILLSDPTAKLSTVQQSEKQLTKELVDAGAIVANLDWSKYVGDQTKAPGKCLQFWELERIGQVLQSQLQLPTIHKPLLVGVAEGGFGAIAARQTYPEMFRGALVVAAPDFIRSINPPCEKGDAVTFTATTNSLAINSNAALQKNIESITDLKPQDNGGVSKTVTAVTSWLAESSVGMPDGIDNFNQYINLVAPPSGDSSNPIFVFASGDGGWAEIDKEISSRLVERGYGVLGINSLQYFWRRREPNEVGHYVQSLVTAKTAAWKYNGIILLGFSLGADVMPATLREASAQLASSVRGIVLLNPGKFAEFEVHLTDWVGLGDEQAGRSIAQDLASITIPVLCISGEDEHENSGCLTNSSTHLSSYDNITRVELPGGHHFSEDYGNVADRIIGWWKSASDRTKQSVP